MAERALESCGKGPRMSGMFQMDPHKKEHAYLCKYMTVYLSILVTR